MIIVIMRLLIRDEKSDLLLLPLLVKRNLCRFYDYWERFDSWRDFTLKAAEHNLEEADSREEKRWMMKENDKRCVCMRNLCMHFYSSV